ncbi:MAG: peptide deformylase [Planctomycetota bacterium]|nr:MAG: peptide deformylase [Planctomycetota bacterium]
MDIVLYPDPRLRRKTAPIENFDQELADIVRAMFEVMYRTKGVGLAAPQVGLSLKLLVYNPEGDPAKSEQERVLANPRILRRSRNKEFGEEGCLSFPGIFGQVERPLEVTVEAQDLNGEKHQLELKDWDARIFLHELDHLDGILFVDRFQPGDKVRVKPQLTDLEAQFRASRASS